MAATDPDVNTCDTFILDIIYFIIYIIICVYICIYTYVYTYIYILGAFVHCALLEGGAWSDDTCASFPFDTMVLPPHPSLPIQLK